VSLLYNNRNSSSIQENGSIYLAYLPEAQMAIDFRYLGTRHPPIKKLEYNGSLVL